MQQEAPKGTRIAHVGVAVKSIAASLPLLTEILGLEQTEIADSDGARIAAVAAGESLVELLEPAVVGGLVSLDIDYEIIFINDCSPDDSAQVIRGFLAMVDEVPSLEKNLRRACDWVARQIRRDGRVTTPSFDAWKLDEAYAFANCFSVDGKLDVVTASRARPDSASKRLCVASTRARSGVEGCAGISSTARPQSAASPPCRPRSWASSMRCGWIRPSRISRLTLLRLKVWM